MTLMDVLENVPADKSKYKSDWDSRYKSKFSSLLERFDSEEIEAIEDIIGTKIKSLDLKSEEAIQLYTIHRFTRNKRDTIREFAEKKDDLITEDEAFLYILKKIDAEYNQIIYHIFLFHQYEKESSERIFKIENSLPKDYLEKFDEELRGFKQALSKGTTSSNFQCPEENRISFLESKLLTIDRKTSDTEKRDVSGIQWRRNLGSIFVEIEDQKVRIRTRSKKIRNKVLEKLSDIWQIELSPADVIEKTIDAEKFSKGVKRDEEGVKILNIDFRNTRDEPTVPLTLSKKSWGVDVSGIARKMDGKIVDVNLLNIRKFWVQIDNAEIKINIKRKSKGRMRLESDIKKIKSRDKKLEIREKFAEVFGVPLDKDILEHEVTDDRNQLISFLLRNPATKDIRKSHEPIIEDLEELGVINVKNKQRRQCASCRNIIKKESISECGKCGGKLEEFGEPLKEVSSSKSGIRKFFKQVLEEQDLDYSQMKPEKIYKKSYKFLPVSYEGDTFDFLLPGYGLGLTDKSISYLMKSLRPVLVVYKGGSINEKWVKEELSEKIDLSEVIDLYLDDNLSKSYIEDKLSVVAEDKERRVAKKAKTAKEELIKIKEDPVGNTGSDPGGEFERELFHILKQLIPTAEQWGEKRSGDQPDGFCEILYKKSGMKYHRSFAYDSKFSKKGSIKLDTSETKTIRGYVHKIINSEQVSQSKTKFRNFVVITNCSEHENFESLAGRLNRMRSWDGVPVLMQVEFLISLHSIYNRHIDLIKDHRNEFMECLFKEINGGKERHQNVDEEFFIEITQENALELMKNFEDRIDDDSINISKLRKWLEKDIYP